MNVQNLVNHVKSGIQHGQLAMAAGVDTLRSANHIVTDSVQSLLEVQKAAARDVVSVAQSSASKARHDSMAVVAKTRDELRQAVREGYDKVAKRFNGEPVTRKEKAEAKKAAVKAKKHVAEQAAGHAAAQDALEEESGGQGPLPH